MIKLRDFQALTFDCYGTLIDWETGILTELRAWAAPAGIADDALLEAFGAEESRCEAATPDKPYPGVLADVHRALGQRWGIEPNKLAPIAFGGSVGRWPAFPDSPEALGYLKQHYKLVILSNVDTNSFARSNQKLAVDFDLILTAQDIGSYKPDPSNFQAAIKALDAIGVPRDRILHGVGQPPARQGRWRRDPAGVGRRHPRPRGRQHGRARRPPPQGTAVKPGFNAEGAEVSQRTRGQGRASRAVIFLCDLCGSAATSALRPCFDAARRDAQRKNLISWS